MIKAKITPARYRALLRDMTARPRNRLKAYGITRQHAETLMKFHARTMFRPHGFHIEFKAIRKYVLARRWKPGSKEPQSLSEKQETQLAMFCLKAAIARKYSTDFPGANADIALALLRHEIMDDHLMDTAFLAVGGWQQDLKFLPWQAWARVQALLAGEAV